MNINIYSLLLGIFGQGIIIAGFLLFRGSCPDNILWLNITVTSIVFWLLGCSFGLEPISLSDRSQKQAGGLGIRWFSALTYAVCAMGFMIGCAVYGYGAEGVPFKWQLIIQVALLFFLLMGFVSSSAATAKTGEIYQKEQNHKQGKADLKATFSNLTYTADSSRELPADVRSRLHRLSEETRFLSPSSSREAEMIDGRLVQLASALRPILFNPGMNTTEIEDLLCQIEVEFHRRKQLTD